MMFTSSISDEDLEVCNASYDHVTVSEAGDGTEALKSPAEGPFVRLVSSQREHHHRHGTKARVESSESLNTAQYFQDQHLMKQELNQLEYDKAFQQSLKKPEEFWAEVGKGLTWFKPWDKVLDDSDPPFTKWFVGGMLNACYNAVDRHVKNGHGDKLALIHDSPVTSSIHQITYSQLLQKISTLAGAYSSIGVKKGDRVLIYMPMIPEAIISMLAAARLGAIHSVVFGGFAARELQTRIEHAEPTVIVAANCGIEPNKIIRYRSILREALANSAHKPSHIIMYERPEINLDGDKHENPFENTIMELDWTEALKTSTPCECVPVEANEPLYILYTSGTTDQPKGVVRPVGGHLATLMWTMHAVYGMGNPGDNFENSQHEDSESLSLECNEYYQNKETEKKMVNSNRLSNDHKEINGQITSSFQKEQNTNAKLAVVPNSMKHVPAVNDLFHYNAMSEEQDKLKDNPSPVKENSSEASSNNLLHKLCLKVHQSLTGLQSSGNAHHTDHHGSKEKEKKVKLCPPSAKNSMIHGPVAHLNECANRENSKNSSIYNSEDNNVLKYSKYTLGDTEYNVNEWHDSKFSSPVESICSSANSSDKCESDEVSSKCSQLDLGDCDPKRSQKEDQSLEKPFNSTNHVGSPRAGKKIHGLSKNSPSRGKVQFRSSGKHTEDLCETRGCESDLGVPSEALKDEKNHHKNGVWWAASDMGWVVGHSYVCYAPLTAGLTSVMYEGKPDRTPDPGQYFRVIETHGVNALLTAPTALRVIKRVDPNAEHGKKYSTQSLKTIFVAGESLDQSTKDWTERVFKVGVVNHWWQTETGHSITAAFMGLGHSPSDPPGLSTGKSFPGFDLHVLRDDGTEAAVGEEGRIAARLPLPPGTLSTLYKDSKMFQSLYFSTYPGYYDTMDAGYVFPDVKSSNGWIVVTGREDDVVSVAGHRLSASAIEAVALQHPDVSDALVVGTPDRTKGEVPLCLYVPTPRWKKNGEDDKEASERISKDLIYMVRKLVGPIAAFHLAFPVPALPKTRSGKIPRKSVARMARGLPLKIPSTVEDPLVYEDIKLVLQAVKLYSIK